MGSEAIVLTEYQTVRLAENELERSIGTAIYEDLKGKVSIEFPSPKTDGCWELRSLGWVGSDVVRGDTELRLQPRNSISASNLFRMIDVAYDLPDEVGMVDVGSVDAFFNKWAQLLSRRVLSLLGQGPYKAYVDQSDDLLLIRGRINLPQLFAHPGRIALPCLFQELTSDVEENRLLAGALTRIVRHRACTDQTFELATQANRALAGLVLEIQTDPSACVGRSYSHLNRHYEALHAICRLFLENAGPSHLAGDRAVTPFLIDTEVLFESFIEKTLKRLIAERHPNRWDVLDQRRYEVGLGKERVFKVDLLLRDRSSGEVQMVLETKSVPTDLPRTEDVEQVVAYAARTDAPEAVLVYPSLSVDEYSEKIGENIRVRALRFALDSDLEETGAAFLEELIKPLV